MDQSFSPSRVNLEEAAELVAVRAALGPAQTKQAYDFSSVGKYLNDNPGLKNSLIGGGLGAGAGLLSGALSNKKDKEWGRRAMLGAGLGAGAGAAMHYGPQLLDAATSDPTLDTMNDFKKIHQKYQAPDASKNDNVLLRWLHNFTDTRPGLDTAPQSVQNQEKALRKSLVSEGINAPQIISDQQPGLTNTLSDAASTYAPTAGMSVAGGAAGYGAGRLADTVVNMRPNNPEKVLSGLTEGPMKEYISKDLRPYAEMRQNALNNTQPRSIGRKLIDRLKGAKPYQMTPRDKILRQQLQKVPRTPSVKFRRGGTLIGALAPWLMELVPPEKVRNILN